MLQYNEVRPGKVIVVDGEPYICINNGVMQTQQRKPVNQCKLKHLVRGNVVEMGFRQQDKLEEADIEKVELKYLFTNKGESWFCDPKNPAARKQLDSAMVADVVKWCMPNTIVEGLMFEGEVVTVKVPIKVELRVTEAPPSTKGDTATGGNKVVTVETGATIQTPLFVEQGDIIAINTEEERYMERVKKN